MRQTVVADNAAALIDRGKSVLCCPVMSSPLLSLSLLFVSTATCMMVMISSHHIISFIWIVYFSIIIITILLSILKYVFLLYSLFRIRFLDLKFWVLRVASYMFIYSYHIILASVLYFIFSQ